MEADRPSAGDYASNAADGARRGVEGASAEIKLLKDRLSLAEKKIEGLFLIINHVADSRRLNSVWVDEETGKVEFMHPDD